MQETRDKCQKLDIQMQDFLEGMIFLNVHPFLKLINL